MLGSGGQRFDDLDARLVAELTLQPRAGIVELARRLGVARGTVQGRIDKLVQRGVITGFGPDLSLEALGYSVLAFVTLEIAQGRLSDVVAHLRAVPEVLECHTATGQGDLHLRVVARSNLHLHEIINRIVEVKGINRSTTVIALSEQIRCRVLPLVEALTADRASAPD
ncbi:MAG TPA: Lrp/AsnC family transcriptional regulator [Acidimicrobiales bacterium]|nr:Lrp/AsnC family transcriptional regulator [Acidimicrobiales bacterium]